jgi:hypothetical protein
LFTAYSKWSSDRRKQLQDAEAIYEKYRDPLLLAARDLQERLFHIVNGTIRTYIYQEEAKKDYLILHTLYLFAQFFAWQLIMRYEIQFFKFQAQDTHKHLANLESKISKTLSCDHPSAGPFMIWKGHQSALGEIVITTDHQDQRFCIGYSEFRKRWREDKTFHEWFARPARDLEVIARARPRVNDRRLQRLQSLLVDLIRLLDPKGQVVGSIDLDIPKKFKSERDPSNVDNV